MLMASCSSGDQSLVLHQCFCVMLQHIRQLQKAAELHQHQVAAMHERLTRVTTELASLSTTANLAHSRAQSANPGRLVASTASVLGSVTRLQQVSL